jgi:hypothetical protein
MKNIKLFLITLLLGMIGFGFTSCEDTKDIPVYYLPIYTNLYLIGSATPVGWNIDAPVPMIVDATDPFTFTWTGQLTKGEFKIPTAKGNWGCDFLMPLVNGETDLTKTTLSLVKGGNPDRKWLITDGTAGNYTITINIKDQKAYTIKFVKN